jgi:hypothetical protein
MLIKDALKITDSFTKTSKMRPAKLGPSFQKFLARRALDAMQ